jgi:hypothetical protein
MGKVIIALFFEVLILALSIQTGELLQINGCFKEDIAVIVEINYKMHFVVTCNVYVHKTCVPCITWHS